MTLLLSQRWCIATTAILTRINREPFHVLGGGRSGETNRQALEQWWGISDRRSLDTTYQWLVNEGHSQDFRQMQELVRRGARPSDLEAAQQYHFVEQHGAEVGTRGLLAWDYGRAAGIMGWSVQAGYIDEKEAWALLLPPAEVLQRAYSSWEEFGWHYALGRSFWSGQSDPRTLEAYEYLKTREDSPWRCIPWVTPLAIPGLEPRWTDGPAALAHRLPARQPVTPHAPGRRRSDAFRTLREADGALLLEEDGRQFWLDAHDDRVPRDHWRDDWGPWSNIAWDYDTPDRVATEFMRAEIEFREHEDSDPLGAEQRLLARGFSSVGQYYRVLHTVAKHLGTPTGPNLSNSLLDGDLSKNTLEASHANQRAEAQRVLAANPELTQAVNGLSFELLALLSAYQTLGLSDQEYYQVLAQHGFDVASYNAASDVWKQRFQTEPTGRLGQRYAELFMEKQQQLRAERAAASGAPAPQALSFEKYCEITGAMAAWGEQGIDMNSEIEKVFGMSMMDYATQGGDFAMKMATDPGYQHRYMELVAEFTNKYGAASAGSRDADIDL